MLAWIYEKLVNWTDGYQWEDDEGQSCSACLSLLDEIRLNVRRSSDLGIYVLVLEGRSNRDSQNLLRETGNWLDMGAAKGPHRLLVLPSRDLETSTQVRDSSSPTIIYSVVSRRAPRWLKQPNLVFESEHTEGGHFPAHEKPDLLVGDLRKMFGKGGPAFGAVSGKTGYA